MLIVDLVESIEKAFESRPKGGKRKDLSDWKQSINRLIEQVNELSKIKMYNSQ